MLTQCPHCETVFRVSAEQLGAAAGRVRCGQCAGVFDAHAHVYDQSLERAAPPTTSEQSTIAEPVKLEVARDEWSDAGDDAPPYIMATRDADEWQPEQALTATPSREDMDELETPLIAADGDTVSAPKFAPLDIGHADLLRAELAPPPAPPAPRHTLGWSLLAVLLILTLGAQYLYFARANLVQYSLLRPILQRVCVPPGCGLPLRHAPQRIELLSRDVISHPRIRAALLINATFVNRADFVQAYPVLQISLSDDSGAVVAMRRFQPEEYLPPGVALAAGLAPSAPVHVVLEVAEPHHSAASFQFEFL